MGIWIDRTSQPAISQKTALNPKIGVKSNATIAARVSDNSFTSQDTLLNDTKVGHTIKRCKQPIAADGDGGDGGFGGSGEGGETTMSGVTAPNGDWDTAPVATPTGNWDTAPAAASAGNWDTAPVAKSAGNWETAPAIASAGNQNTTPAAPPASVGGWDVPQENSSAAW